MPQPRARLAQPSRHRLSIQRPRIVQHWQEPDRTQAREGAQAHSAVAQLYTQVDIERQVQREVQQAVEDDERRQSILRNERREIRRQQLVEAILAQMSLPEGEETDQSTGNPWVVGSSADDRDNDCAERPVAVSPTKTRYRHEDGPPSDVWGRTYRIRTAQDPVAVRIAQLRSPSDGTKRLTEGQRFDILSLEQVEQPQTMSQYLEQACRLSVLLPLPLALAKWLSTV